MKLGHWMGCCLLLEVAVGVTHAQTALQKEVLKTAEASMVLTGTIDVNPDGSLHGYTIDKRERVPAEVASIVDRNVSHWTFKLSAPATDVIHTKMSLLVRAKPAGDGTYLVDVSGTSFGESDNKTGAWVSYKSRKQPAYPRDAVDARVSGTVFLVLRIGREGTVEEAVVEQVNLDRYGAKSAMESYRKMLAGASLRVAKDWTFNLPTHGNAVDNPYWEVRVPVKFFLVESGVTIADHPYGTWSPYFPGPRQSPPWLSKALLSEAPDALPGEGLHAGDSGLQLATPLGGA
ncbi:MAG TPA: energy transducer TonB [Dyella sp.]|uniref:energy transducer TonB n=1 Tax=Dyella sp. TaxID=1869338 RepID=UPI002D790918|nr:energy transducer TonB [Dyella sp.]HET6552563.1 energy transducer TonB [Dyella sp.]